MLDILEGADRGLPTAAADKCRRGLGFGSHGARGEMAGLGIGLEFFHIELRQEALGGGAEVDRQAGNIRGHDEMVDTDIPCQTGARQVLVDHGIHPVKAPSLPYHRNTAATAANDDKTHLDQLFDFAPFDHGQGLGGGHHTPQTLGRMPGGVGVSRGRRVQHRTDGLGGVGKGRVVFIHHHIADEGDKGLFEMNAQIHEGRVQGGLDHVADLPLGLRHQDLQR